MKRISSSRTLRITYVGMKPQDVPIKPGTIKVMMKSDSEVLQEVVVTGMQKMDKRLFTGATKQLDADNVKLDGLPDISRGLEGRAAGVSVQNVSGTFGTAPKIRVRGATSIYGSSKPLWVVDGVILEDVIDVGPDDLSSGDAETLISSAIAGLNSDDIESFQILKDGSATSIYGARAMAGVIVVTTKKGRAGVSKISYTGEFTTRAIPSYKEFNIMNSQEQMGIYKEMEQKGWLNSADLFRTKDTGVYGRMYRLIDEYNNSNGQRGLLNTPESRNAYLREAEMRNTDWFDVLFTNAISQNHSVSITAGTEKSSFYASLSAMLDPGWYKQSKVKRYTANVNTTYNLYKNLSINLISNASYRQQNAPGTMSSTLDIASGKMSRGFDINPYSYALNTSRTLDPSADYISNYAPFNILHELDNNYIEINMVDVKFQGELKWKVIQGLELSALGAVRYQTSSQEHNVLDDANQAVAYRTGMDDATIREQNGLLYKDPDNPYALPITLLPEGGIYQRQDRRMLGLDFRGTLSWNHLFAEKHITNFFAGMEVNSLKKAYSSFQGWGMQYSMGEIPSYVYQFFKNGIESGSRYYSLGHSETRSIASFLNATYSYDGRYTLNGTFRYEGTNRMGRSRSSRWLPTWNLSGAWNVHEEAFFKALQPTLSNLTLKASYSLTADRGPAEVTNSQAIIRSFSPYRPFTDIQETGLYIEELANLRVVSPCTTSGCTITIYILTRLFQFQVNPRNLFSCCLLYGCRSILPHKRSTAILFFYCYNVFFRFCRCMMDSQPDSYNRCHSDDSNCHFSANRTKEFCNPMRGCFCCCTCSSACLSGYRCTCSTPCLSCRGSCNTSCLSDYRRCSCHATCLSDHRDCTNRTSCDSDMRDARHLSNIILKQNIQPRCIPQAEFMRLLLLYRICRCLSIRGDCRKQGCPCLSDGMLYRPRCTSRFFYDRRYALAKIIIRLEYDLFHR